MLDKIKMVVRAWECHAKTSLGFEKNGRFVQVAEVNSPGSDDLNDEEVARRMAACWNACAGVDTQFIELSTGFIPADVPYGLLVERHNKLLQIVKTSIGNVRSLGPAGALSRVDTPYEVWLQELVKGVDGLEEIKL